MHCVGPTGVLQGITNNVTYPQDFFHLYGMELMGGFQITTVIPLFRLHSFSVFSVFPLPLKNHQLFDWHRASCSVSHLLVIHCYPTASLECLVPSRRISKTSVSINEIQWREDASRKQWSTYSGAVILWLNSVWVKRSLLPEIICMQYENTKWKLKFHLKPCLAYRDFLKQKNMHPVFSEQHGDKAVFREIISAPDISIWEVTEY